MEEYIYILEDTQGNRQQFDKISYEEILNKMTEIRGVKLHIYRKFKTLTD